MAAAITAREFKLLLKPELFPTKQAVLEFNDRLVKLAKDAGVQYDRFDRIDSEMRSVQFFDTSDCVFREQPRDLTACAAICRAVGPDETFEVTFKRRSPDFRESADFDIDTTMKEISAEEEVQGRDFAWRHAGNSIKSIFSNNLIGYYPVVKFERPLSEIVGDFPGLKTLNLDGSQDGVGREWRASDRGRHAARACYSFGKNTAAHCDLAVWTRPAQDTCSVLVAEFGWSYHMRGEGKQQKAHETADQFFKDCRSRMR